ncbi:serine protein kinase RIO [Brachybacterium saurashtrense]|uniref:non-specific serine/threonine protein kinase n=1 Tax=Brachybacterium saurashtrense TaxID=556288 RepID=A0A345YK01_9MICO|nr:RIO1 family regulatory kinase/ATPase [Brachybacterium saurashtrense]AXK44253.1 serine/threonine protein kinase [Brachybacterium saurashtrense]RRR21525.1 serine/threonine protein kinase [Brachybacterium saurashtrense]
MTSSFDRDAFFARSMYTLSLAELDEDQRWSTWPETAHTLDRGPQPFPDWVVQHDGAVDTELGILKTGKEADAFLLERALPAAQRTGAPGEETLLVAKRYRAPELTTFHRSSAYTEGRRTKDTREARAIAKGTAFGRQAAAGQWARTEFEVLGRLWRAGVPVPYPVQIVGTELLMEFVGTDDVDGAVAAPRLQETRPDAATAERWARRLREAVLQLAELGLVHGDLSPYNVLADSRQAAPDPVIIDVPQVIDLIANPHGGEYLRRDCATICTWLCAQGAPPSAADPEEWCAAAWRAGTRS